MKRPFIGGILLALPLSLLAFSACGDESIVKTNDIKQISEDDSQSSSSESSSSSLIKSSSSSSKSSKKFSLSSKAEEVSVEDDDVESKGDLPRCTISREGVEVYVKEEKKLYTCEEGAWIPEKETAESSSSSSNSKKLSSSSKLNIASLSSSSVIYIDVDFSSSSEKGGPVAVTGLGKCAPAKTPISKGETVTWRFSPNADGPTYKVMDFVKATYVWDLGGLLDDGSQISTTSGKVTYTSSGVYNASVKVAMEDGGFEDIQCELLQVNGDPITGCKCTASETSVDYTTTPDVTWTVSGCTSASEINSYVWNGVAGAETFTKRFDEAQSGYAPTLKVGNDDNTVVDVICDAVKTTMGAEFLFEKQDTKVTLPAGESNVVFDLPPSWHYSADGDCTFRCDGAYQPITITIGTETSKPSYAASIKLPVSKTINKTMMTVTLDVAADCQVSY